jgi:large subunit ribosomal protein L9
MLVLLQANVPNLGQIGDLVKVKSGFARNFLFPRELAVLADERNKKLLDHQRRQAAAKKQKTYLVERAQKERYPSMNFGGSPPHFFFVCT